MNVVLRFLSCAAGCGFLFVFVVYLMNYGIFFKS